MDAGRLRGDEGLSLIEMLIAIAILGIAVVGIIAGLGASIQASRVHRQQAETESVLFGAVERVKAVSHTACATAATTSYSNAAKGISPAVALPANWNTGGVVITNIEYWNGSAFGTNSNHCYDNAAEDPYHVLTLQKITITATHPSGQRSQTMIFVKS